MKYEQKKVKRGVVLRRLSWEWKMPPHGWVGAKTQFAVKVGNRVSVGERVQVQPTLHTRFLIGASVNLHTIAGEPNFMHDIAFPARKTDDARRADEELVTVLEQMTSSIEQITVRAVIRRMSTLGQPSSITRDVWRMSQIVAAEQKRISVLAEGSATLDEEARTQISDRGAVPNIHFLLSFVCIARTGNFGYAARELKVSQPALSRQIQAVEKAFGAKLLLRHGQGVTLTGAGSRLLHRLNTALPLLTAPLVRHEGTEPDARTLSFGVASEVGGSIIAGIVQQFRARWPHLKLKVDEGPSPVLEEALVDHRLNFAILQDAPSLESMYKEVVLTDRLGLIASPRSPIADDSSPIHFNDLASLPLVLPGEQHNIRRHLEKASFMRGIRLSPFLETDSLQLAKAVVRSSLAFTVLPSLLVQEELERGSLIFRDIVQPTMTTTCAVAVNRESLSPLGTEFIAAVREAMVSLVGTSDQGLAQVTRLRVAR